MFELIVTAYFILFIIMASIDYYMTHYHADKVKVKTAKEEYEDYLRGKRVLKSVAEVMAVTTVTTSAKLLKKK